MVGLAGSVRRAIAACVAASLGVLIVAPNASASLTECGRFLAHHPAAHVMRGTSGDDLLHGTARRDVIITGRGDDVIDGGDGGDWICSGRGRDVIHGSFGRDVQRGGRGADRLFGGWDSDSLVGGPGADIMHGGARPDSLQGGPGDDLSYGERDADTFYLGSGDDEDIGGDPGRSVSRLYAFPGGEPSVPTGVPLIINVPAGTVDGWGHDTMSGLTLFQLSWPGPVTFIGSAADEVFFAFSTEDVTADGAAGNDVLAGDYVLIGSVTFDGGPGNDTLYGQASNDTLIGGDGDDHIDGFGGDDQLDGGAGTDELIGADGDDTCVNGEVLDTCEH